MNNQRMFCSFSLDQAINKSINTQAQSNFNQTLKEQEVKQVNEYNSIQNNIKVKCTGQNPPSKFCTLTTCKTDNIFCCSEEKCPCNQQHKKCLLANLRFPLQKISIKTSLIQTTKKQIQKVFQAIEQSIKTQKYAILQDFNKKIQKIYLSEIQNQFITVLSAKQKVQKFNSQKGRSIWEKTTSQQDLNCEIFTKINQEMNNLQNKLHSQFQKFTQRMELIIDDDLLEEASDSQLQVSVIERHQEYHQQLSLNMQNDSRVNPEVIQQNLKKYQRLRQLHQKLSQAIQNIKQTMSYSGSSLDVYSDSKAYFHVGPKRECIDVYQRLKRLNLSEYQLVEAPLN